MKSRTAGSAALTELSDRLSRSLGQARVYTWLAVLLIVVNPCHAFVNMFRAYNVPFLFVFKRTQCRMWGGADFIIAKKYLWKVMRRKVEMLATYETKVQIVFHTLVPPPLDLELVWYGYC